MKNETGLTKNQIITALTKSPHGKLSEYVPIGLGAASQEPEFFAHMIAWNEKKGQIRDSKVALPVLSLSCATFPEDFLSNSLAHLALLSPRDFVRGLRFAMTIKTPGRMKSLKRLAERYLRAREANWAWFEKTAVQHRRTLKELYALTHTKPSTMAEGVLFKGERPRGSIFEAVANLKDMAATEAAGTIMEKRIPFLIAMGALGAKAKEPDLVLALIGRMSPTELVTNTKLLERLGVKTVPALRAAFEAGLVKAAKSKKATLKTTAAADTFSEDDPLREKLRALQEKQIAAVKREAALEGNWIVLGDKSGSMQASIEASRHIAATLAKLANGTVSLIFFDVTPRYIDATGKDYDKLLALTKHVTADGGTSIGCGLMCAIEKKLEVDGIAIVSDGGENAAPMFAPTYKAYCQSVGKQIPVYLYKLRGNEADKFTPAMKAADIDIQTFDLTGGVDYYSLPTLAQTMRVQRYGLIEEIMDCPLLDLDAILPVREKAVA